MNGLRRLGFGGKLNAAPSFTLRGKRQLPLASSTRWKFHQSFSTSFFAFTQDNNNRMDYPSDHENFLNGAFASFKPCLIPSRPPPSECADYQEQFRTNEEQNYAHIAYTRNLKDAEARAILVEYVKSIQADREFLLRCLAFHGNTVLGRWKKSREKRRACILQVN